MSGRIELVNALQTSGGGDTRAVLRDPLRLEALRQVALLDTPVEEAFDRLTRLAAQILNAPVALVSLVDAEREFFKSCIGLPEPWASGREAPLSHSFCQHVVGTAGPIVIEDAREHPLVRDNLAILDLNVVAYAGIPLVTADGHALGSFCAIDHHPRRWTERELATLRDLAASVMTEIELRTALALRARAERARAALLERESAARQEAEAAARFRDEVLAIVAHDLRNPLMGILANASLLLRAPASEEVRAKRLHTIRCTGERMGRLIGDLLDVAAIQAGRLAVEPQRLEVAPLLTAACEIIQPQAVERGLELTCRAADAIPDVRADQGLVLQALGNLLENAVRYTPAGGRITAAAELIGDEIRISVSDTGPGISEDDVPHLFKRFWRARRHPEGGAGLGLAIARGVVEAHGGRIWVESRVGQGCTFYMTLPAERS